MRCARPGSSAHAASCTASARRFAQWDADVAAGRTGDAGHFSGQFHCNALHAPWWRDLQKSGGQIAEQLIHIIDLARHALGEPQSVYARASNLFHRDVPGYSAEDVSAIILGYDDGRIGVLHASNAAVPGRWAKQWQIVAADMTGIFQDWNTAEFVRTRGEVTARRIAGERDVFVAQLEDVATAVRRAASAPGPAGRRRGLASHCPGGEAIGRREAGGAALTFAQFDPETLAFHVGGIRLAGIAPLIDGSVPAAAPGTRGGCVRRR